MEVFQTHEDKVLSNLF